MKIIFAGTPDIAVFCLEALCRRYAVSAVLTMPDRPTGRGKKIEASPVKQSALKHHIPVLTPEKIDAEILGQLKALQPDLIVVVAYGHIFPEALLTLPRWGCWNVHYSLLPRWRGAAPVQRAIEAGDTETGVTVMQMQKGLDTGNILLAAAMPILATDTAESLSSRLAELGATTLLEALEHRLQLQPKSQNPVDKTYAKKLEKAEGAVCWDFSAERIERQIRAFQPWPVCYSELEGQRVRFWKSRVISEFSAALPGTIVAVANEGIDVATGRGILRLLECQLSSKKVMSVRELLNSERSIWTVGRSFKCGPKLEQI